MTNEQIKDVIVRVVTRIAPEARGLTLAPDLNLREQLDLDSMDMLNFVIGLHEELRVDIPESDYARLTTIDSAVRYVAERLGGPRAPDPR